MHTLALLLLIAVSLLSSTAQAASYQLTNGTLVDPIQCYIGCTGAHPYAGPDLAPGAVAPGATLIGADLS